MPYLPFILKYRPRTFDDVVGQEHVSRTLRNAIASGRLVHAYLFTGPRGTGKTTMARILARALNCVNGPTVDPCGVCDQCVSIIEGRSMDIIEIDAASHTGVENVRDLRESIAYAPAEGRCKLYILDEAHMLSTPAFNALLKTLEEPPAHAYFALLTTEAHKIIPTILSRCQRFDFRPVSVNETVGMLRRIAQAEGLTVQDEALMAIAHAAEGAMRDAESIFEQVVAFSDGAITLEIANEVLGVTDAETLMQTAEIVARHDLAAVFPLVDRLVSEGKNLVRLVEDLTSFFRDLLRLTLSGSGGSVWLQLGPQGEARMRQVAESIGSERLLAAVHSLAELCLKLKDSAQHALLLELTLTELSNPPASTPRAGPRPAAPQGSGLESPSHLSSAAPEPVASRSDAGTRAAAASRPAPMSLDGPLTCEIIWSHWESVMDELRRSGSPNVRAFVVDAVPTGLDGDTLTLSFPSHCQFHVKQLKNQHRETVQKALQHVFGRALTLDPRLCDVNAPPQPPGTAGVGEEAKRGRGEEATATAPEVEAPAVVPVETAAPVEAEAAAPEPAPPALEPAPPAPEPAPPAPEAPDDFQLQPGGAPEPGQTMTTDEAVAQTLSLFEGGQEILPADENHQ